MIHFLNRQQSSSDTTAIEFDGDSISVSGTGAIVNGSVVTINAVGTYTLSGTLNDGQVIVDSADEEPVNLILNGVDITSSSSSPIFDRTQAPTGQAPAYQNRNFGRSQR